MKRGKKGVVSIWLGNFESEEALEAYVEEQYEDDEAPLSRFTADYDLGWIDHDFQEVGYSTKSVSVEAFLAGNSYSKSFVREAAKSAASAGVRERNAKILLYDYEIETDDRDRPLTFIGSFPYQRNSASSSSG